MQRAHEGIIAVECEIVAGVKIGATATVEDDLDPAFDENFCFRVCHSGVTELTFEVKDKNIAGSTLLGECSLSLSYLLSLPQSYFIGALPLSLPGKKPKVSHRWWCTVTHFLCTYIYWNALCLYDLLCAFCRALCMLL
jgi:hypothetical protein